MFTREYKINFIFKFLKGHQNIHKEGYVTNEICTLYKVLYDLITNFVTPVAFKNVRRI